MPYEPYSPTQEQRENYFRLVWLGGLISLAMVVLSILGVAGKSNAWAMLIVGAYLITFTCWNKYDDYFKRLVLAGAKWAVVVVGIWLLANGLLEVFELARDTGIAAAGADPSEADPAFAPVALLRNAMLLAGLCALAFHAGFLFSHHRGDA